MAQVSYRVEFAPSALREFRDLPRKFQAQLGPKIDALSRNPRPQRVEKLKGQANQYRIRSGSFRVIYSIFDDRLLVLILKVGDRKSIYRDL